MNETEIEKLEKALHLLKKEQVGTRSWTTDNREALNHRLAELPVLIAEIEQKLEIARQSGTSR